MIEEAIKHIKDRIKFSDLRPEIVIKKESAEAVLSELETYKKMAEILAKRVSETGECYFISSTHCEKYSDKSCDECIVQCILEWAKREVANDKQS